MVDSNVPELPSEDAPPSEWVRYGELRAGGQFSQELTGYFELAQALIDSCGLLVARVEQQPGTLRPLHVAALILSRIASELAAVTHLLRRGYAAQAITLVGTMLELTHVLAYIGAEESRAGEWAAWNNPTKSYPGPVYDTIHATASVFGADAASLEREYAVIYRQICQIKHGNTIALALPNAAIVADMQCIVIGPLVSADFIRLGHAAAQWATRYAMLASTAFIRFHVPSDEWDALFARQVELSQRHRDLVLATKGRFADPASG